MNNQEIIKLAENLGVIEGLAFKEQIAKESGGLGSYDGSPFDPDKIYTFYDEYDKFLGAMILWMSEKASFVYYKKSDDAFVKFCSDHMDNIAEYALGNVPEYESSIALYRHKVKLFGDDLPFVYNNVRSEIVVDCFT